MIPANALLVDTGFLVALFRRRDRLRSAARNFLVASKAPLVTAAPVIVETCFFLKAEEKQNLLEWVRRGALDVREAPLDAYPRISWLIGKHADRDPDFTDMALLWLAQESGCRRVLTVDAADFAVYRGKSGKALDLPQWMD
ncbi:MAG: PIN domain-containing protein [Sulfurisoma sp.]|nr:PIN domain-containing protein [Sulfurisoma sp.]